MRVRRRTYGKHCRGYGVCVVQSNRERWMELAELAATEQDGAKLVALTNEIDRLLAEKQNRLDHSRIPPKP